MTSAHAMIDRHNPMGTGLIDAGNNLFFMIDAERRLHFVAVMKWIFHAEDGHGFPIWTQETVAKPLLPEKLFCIRKILHLTAAAFAVMRTSGLKGCCHQ